MQIIVLATLSILWKLAVLPVLVGFAARLLRRRLLRTARTRFPVYWRADAHAAVMGPERGRLWHLRGMGVLVMDARFLWFQQVWPRQEDLIPLADVRDVFALGMGKSSVLRVETADQTVHMWRVPDAESWAEELRARCPV